MIMKIFLLAVFTGVSRAFQGVALPSREKQQFQKKDMFFFPPSFHTEGRRRTFFPRFEAATLGSDQLWGPLLEKETKKKILSLMSDTGGGHRASAQALASALESMFPIDCEILDIWTECAPWPYKNFVPYYQYVAKRPWLWRFMWAYAKFPLTRRVQELVARIQCFRPFEEAIEKRNPDLIVSVHPLTQTIPLRVRKHLDEKKGTTTPFVTVVTDLGSAHPTWFHKDVDKCFVPSESIKKIARKVGVCDSKVVQHGLPLREAFWKSEERSKPEIRKTLGLPPDLTTALVVGGGDGVGRISKLAKSIGRELEDSEDSVSLVVVCGKNDEAKRELEDHLWPKNVHPTILGFVKNMDEYMAAADCLVTKAGPGTIAEASTRGLPTLISSYLPGQEAGNVRYVTIDKKFGVFRRRPRRIAKTIKEWLKDDVKRSQLSHRAQLAATLDATTNIARDIGSYLFGSSGTHKDTTTPN